MLLGAKLHNVGDYSNPVTKERPLTVPEQRLAEIVVTEESLLNKATLRHSV